MLAGGGENPSSRIPNPPKAGEHLEGYGGPEAFSTAPQALFFEAKNSACPHFPT